MAITAGSNLNSVPASAKQTLNSNYIDFTSSGTAGWALVGTDNMKTVTGRKYKEEPVNLIKETKKA